MAGLFIYFFSSQTVCYLNHFVCLLRKGFAATLNVVDEKKFTYTKPLKNLIMKKYNRMLLSHGRVRVTSNALLKSFTRGEF